MSVLALKKLLANSRRVFNCVISKEENKYIKPNYKLSRYLNAFLTGYSKQLMWIILQKIEY